MLPGSFDNSGTLIFAENVGGTAQTFDGILFGSGETSNPNRITFGAYASFTSSGNTQLQRFGTYGNTASTLTLSNLVVGQDYRVQALVYDGRGGTTYGRSAMFDGVGLGQYAWGVSGVSWGPGMVATGNFTADAITQMITIETFEDTTYTTSTGSQLNAIAVHAVPEPPAAFLILAGLSSFALRRRRT